MFLRQLTIKNLRALHDVQLTFDAAAGKTRKWTLLLGENGCGKSTVLRAAALLLAGSDALPHLLGRGVDDWIRYDTAEASIAAVLTTAEGEERAIQLTLPRGASVNQLFEVNRQTLAQLDEAVQYAERNYLTMGYGASRRLTTDPEAAFSRNRNIPRRARSVATLFSPDAALDPLEAWVIDMDYRGRKRQGQKLITQIAKDLMPEVDFHGIDRVHKQLLFKTPDGITPLTQLSDGYQNVAAWCGDLLRSITEAFHNYDNPLIARGLLLVDEIDLHLHPVWQRRLRSFLERSFPNIQFLATTHSPLTVQQAGEGEVVVMKRLNSKEGPIAEPFAGAPNTMMIHQLLMSPIFDLETLDSLEVQKKRKRYRALKKKTARTKQETKKLKALRGSLQALPDMATGLKKINDKHTRVLEEIKQALQSSRGSAG